MNTEPGTAVMIFAILFGLGLFAGYVWLSIYVIRKAWALTVGWREAVRILFCALVATVFFAPAPIGSSHGAGIGPAWAALIDPDSNRHIVSAALISLTSTWGLFSVIGIASYSIQKRRKK